MFCGRSAAFTVFEISNAQRCSVVTSRLAMTLSPFSLGTFASDINWLLIGNQLVSPLCPYGPLLQNDLVSHGVTSYVVPFALATKLTGEHPETSLPVLSLSSNAQTVLCSRSSDHYTVHQALITDYVGCSSHGCHF